MKNVNLLLVAMLMLASNMVLAQEPDGLTCESAILVDTSYVGSVPAAGTYYYSASTYDLPMTCYFYPETTIDQTPKIYVDFTCTPGVYEDPNLQNMIMSASGWGVETPIAFYFNRSLDEYNREVYTLTINESYREMMTMFDITYNIDAIIQLVAPSAGEITMRPDTTFKACVENSEWLNMPDIVVTGIQHESDSYVLPFVEWRNDSIRFRWMGTESPATVWIGEDCNFEMKLTGDNCALDMFVLHPDKGNGENIRNFSKQEISDYISLFGEGGVYYMRTVCSEDGELVIEKKPMDEAMAKAIPMALDQASEVAANATEQVYYFPKEWANYNVIWQSSAAQKVTAHFASNVNFEGEALGIEEFQGAEAGCELRLSRKQMNTLFAGVQGDHIFVKFISNAPTTITPVLWSAGPCVEGADEIYVNDSVQLQRNATNTAWRVNIEQWAKQDVKLYWEGTSSIKIFLCDTCKGFTLGKNNQHVKLYKEIIINSNATRDTLILAQDELAAVVQYADADGFMYFRFNNGVTSSMIVKTDVEQPITPGPVYTYESAAVCFGETYDWNGQTYTESGEYTYKALAANGADSIVTLTLTVYPQTPATTEEVTVKFGETYEWNGVVYNESGEYTITLQDENGCDYQATLILTVLPEEKPVSPCVAASTLLEPVAELTLNLGNAFDIYRIDYEAWLASGVNLVWTGKGALHTFVAKDCEFAVAVYHKDVVNYTEVPAEGNVVLSKAILAPLAQYVDADGYLYVRFLTELEGQLTTTLAE